MPAEDDLHRPWRRERGTRPGWPLLDSSEVIHGCLALAAAHRSPRRPSRRLDLPRLVLLLLKSTLSPQPLSLLVHEFDLPPSLHVASSEEEEMELLDLAALPLPPPELLHGVPDEDVHVVLTVFSEAPSLLPHSWDDGRVEGGLAPLLQLPLRCCFCFRYQWLRQFPG